MKAFIVLVIFASATSAFAGSGGDDGIVDFYTTYGGRSLQCTGATVVAANPTGDGSYNIVYDKSTMVCRDAQKGRAWSTEELNNQAQGNSSN